MAVPVWDSEQNLSVYAPAFFVQIHPVNRYASRRHVSDSTRSATHSMRDVADERGTRPCGARALGAVLSAARAFSIGAHGSARAPPRLAVIVRRFPQRRQRPDARRPTRPNESLWQKQEQNKARRRSELERCRELGARRNLGGMVHGASERAASIAWAARARAGVASSAPRIVPLTGRRGWAMRAHLVPRA